MRRLVPILLAAAALVAFVSPAGAVKPDRYPGNLEDLLLEGLCPFDVQMDILRDRTKAMDFYDQAGSLVRTQYSGSIVIGLTNRDSDASIEVNVGGPGADIYNADGTVTSTYLGRGIPLLTDSNLTRGRFEFLLTGDFSEVIATTIAAGYTEDVCQLLGG